MQRVMLRTDRRPVRSGIKHKRYQRKRPVYLYNSGCCVTVNIRLENVNLVENVEEKFDCIIN